MKDVENTKKFWIKLSTKPNEIIEYDFSELGKAAKEARMAEEAENIKSFNVRYLTPTESR